MDLRNDDLLATAALLDVAMTGPDDLAALVAAAQVLRTLADDVEARVFNARAAGSTWAEVGEALGMTRQAAQQRFSD